MLKELFDAICTKATDALRPTIIKTPEPEHCYTVAMPDGTLTFHEAKPGPRDHRCNALGSFVEYANKAPAEIVWFSRGGAVAILDDSTRRDRVTFPLTLTPHVQTLAGLVEGAWRDQKAFLFLLRVKLAGCLSSSPSLIPTIQRIKFTTNSDGHGIVEATKRSTGQRIESEITGVGTIPEMVTLDVPVFQEYRHCEQVECAIEVDPASAKFQLLPLPGAIEKAIRCAESMFGGELSSALDNEIGCYYGNP